VGKDTGITEEISGCHIVCAIQHNVILADDGKGGGGSECDVIRHNLFRSTVQMPIQ